MTKEVRDAIREMARSDSWTIAALAKRMNISPTHSEWLTEALLEQKILERKPELSWDKENAENRYGLGEYGKRFLLARMLKPIDRAKVNKIIAELLKRTDQINANPEVPASGTKKKYQWWGRERPVEIVAPD